MSVSLHEQARGFSSICNIAAAAREGSSFIPSEAAAAPSRGL
jgi:hypothetical protein